MSASIDTNTLVWGLQQPHYKRPKSGVTDELRSLRERSRWLFEDLAQRKTIVVVSSVAVAEFLIGVDPRRHGDMIAEIQEMFVIHPFDLPAMSYAARLWDRHRDLPKAEQLDRYVLKADVQIVATAKSAGVSTFYSHDKKARGLAETLGMNAMDLPTVAPDLFANSPAEGDEDESG